MPGEKRLCTGCHDSHDRDRVINDLEVLQTQEVRNRSLARIYDSGFHNADNVMNHPSARTDTVDFFERSRPTRLNTVQAAFERKCMPCHGITYSGGPAGGLRLENLATDKTGGSGMGTTTSVYDSLMEARYRTPSNAMLDYVSTNGARRSPLMWVMYGRQLNNSNNTDYRALAYDHTQLWSRDQFNRIDPFLPANADLLMMIEWMDAGGQYSNTVLP